MTNPAIIRHTLTSNGLREGALVQFTKELYARMGVDVPLHKPVFLITGIHTVNGAHETVELMWNKDSLSGYIVADPDTLEAI